jgi:Na+-translocating ferredoxin:NAD+ oxidoreductase subunit D
MTKSYSMEPSPHLRHALSDRKIMRDVIIACLFPVLAATYLFGFWVLVMSAVGMGTAVLFEAGYQKIRGLPVTVSDYSAAVTGLLLAMSLPVTAPLWTLVAGTFFAIIVVKQIPGGIGKNPINPAVAARILLKILFEPHITQWVLPGPDAVATRPRWNISDILPGLYHRNSLLYRSLFRIHGRRFWGSAETLHSDWVRLPCLENHY